MNEERKQDLMSSDGLDELAPQAGSGSDDRSAMDEMVMVVSYPPNLPRSCPCKRG